jgi:hypothetical protein
MELGLERPTSLMTDEISMQTTHWREHVSNAAVPHPMPIRLPAVADDAVSV